MAAPRGWRNLTRMLVAVDTRLARSPTGMGTYTRELVGALGRLDPPHEFLLLSAEARLPPGGRRFREALIPIRRRWAWSQLFLRRWLSAERAELYHALDGLALPPRPPCPTVITVHDLIPLSHPELVCRRTRLAFRALLGPALRRARVIVSVSGATRDELVRWTKARPERIRVVPLGVSGRFTPARDEGPEGEVAGRWGLSSPYVLAFGGDGKRKNLSRLLEGAAAAGEILGDPVRVAVVGASRAPTAPPRGVIPVPLGRVTEQELVLLYRRATLLAFPSLAEGFGLPPLEAMAAGTPVVVSDIPAHREVVASAGLMVDPRDAREIARGLVELMQSPEKREEYRQRGLERASVFSWEKTAGATVEIYEEVYQETCARSHSSRPQGPTTTVRAPSELR